MLLNMQTESEFPLTLLCYIYSCVAYSEVRIEIGEQAYMVKLSKICNCPCRRNESEGIIYMSFQTAKGLKK